ncbi:CHAT domain-containing protein [Coleofasciculus sp. E2-BRE-01]|uniref:CHAT domain-containing protein n=1 Tax=Coleofasciculus sp. E2-BRE-01 TaxID=3069524 RepID=UPI0032F95D46
METAQQWFDKSSQEYEAGNYEAALASLDKALKIEIDPYKAWLAKGVILSNLGRYQESLDCFDKILQFKPDDYETWYNKGIVFRDLQRYKEALDCCDKALQFKSDCYEVWHNKGTIFLNSQRYKEALGCYNKALQFKPDHYQSWYTKGAVFQILNQHQEALDCYDKALGFKPDYYEAWYTKGKTLSYLGHYQKAIDCYNKAINFKPDFPEALTHKGNVLSDLGRHQEALKCYDLALHFNPNLFPAWDNKGVLLYDLQRYKEAIDSYDRALQLTNNQSWKTWAHRALAASKIEGDKAKIKNYNNGLQALQPNNPEYNEGCGYLHWQKGQAYYSQGKQQQNCLPYWRDAKRCYQQALQFLTSPHLRLQRLEVLQDLIQVYRGLNQTQDVQVLLAEATDLLGRLLQEMSLDADKIRLSRKFSSLVQLRVDELAHSPEPTHPIKALELAEERKNLCLRWLRYGTYKSTEESPSYEQMQHLLNPHTAIIYWHISPAAITTFILGHEQPLQVLKPRNPGTNGNHPQSPPPSFQQLLKFEDWIKTWKQDYQTYRQFDQRRNQANSRDGGNLQPCIPSDEEKRWIKTMPKSLKRLKELLNIPGIVQYLKQHCPSVTHLILVPHRDLHLLPIHALFPDNFTITYLPSIKVGLDNQQRKATQRTQPLSLSLLSVENPLGDLKYASLESAAICQLYPQLHRLPKSRATLSAIQQAFSQPINIFHFSGHGEHNLEYPHQSHLKLANDEELILKDIFAADLSHCHLVCLSACETGLTSQSGLIDEFVGLASGFLAAGVTHIVGSLWNVNDLSTTFLMLKFHETLQENPDDVSRALRQAQYWLKNATKRELKPMIKRLPLKSTSRIKLNKFLNKIDDNRKPFASPFYWAAFCPIG